MTYHQDRMEKLKMDKLWAELGEKWAAKSKKAEEARALLLEEKKSPPPDVEAPPPDYQKPCEGSEVVENNEAEKQPDEPLISLPEGAEDIKVELTESSKYFKMNKSLNSANSKQMLGINGKPYTIFNVSQAAENLGFDASRLPLSLKVVFENLLRNEDGTTVTKADFQAIAKWLDDKTSSHEIAYRPARVLMQDFTGVPAVVDLAAMRDAARDMGGDPEKINPLIPVDLVIDHSVQVDKYATQSAFTENVHYEMERNKARYEFLKWGQKSFNNFRVVPPGTGICHQVNLENLAKVVWTKCIDGENFAYPDTLVGTDSHTTMVNALAVLGWGVGGIEAEAAMLGQPISMLLPEVVGFKIIGKLKEGTTATDMVLMVTQMLREKGVVGKFVEFYGPGLEGLAIADRATISNMAPEYGATCGFFPVDEETIKYMKLTGRSQENIDLTKTYAKEVGLWRDDSNQMEFTDTLELDLSEVQPSLAGPKRPQDRVTLSRMNENFKNALPLLNRNAKNEGCEFEVEGGYKIKNGDVVIAAITSCTNTSNPYVMIGAGLLARNAVKRGMKVKPWVKTSLAPGSKVVTEYLTKAGLQKDLDELGFQLVGYGCTTCIGNSGPLKPEIEKVIGENDLVVTSVLSGNRNFEGRIHPFVRANYLASPPLCVAYALAGSVNVNLTTDSLGKDSNGTDVYLRDIWPSNEEINEYVRDNLDGSMFKRGYEEVFSGDKEWQKLQVPEGLNYTWNESDTYIKNPPYFEGMSMDLTPIQDIKGAHLFAMFGDTITTDHISPAGAIPKGGPAESYLIDNGVERKDFNSFGSRRGNHEVMMRGTFANIRIKNELCTGVEGGFTKYKGVGDNIHIFDAAERYQKEGLQTVIVAGKEYGTGSSRDWAAKGTKLLGVKAVITESFERIHRSNLVGMGVMPLVFTDGDNPKSLGLEGTETFDISGLSSDLSPHKIVDCTIHRGGKMYKQIKLMVRLDTEVEIEYMQNGGILHYVLRNLVSN